MTGLFLAVDCEELVGADLDFPRIGWLYDDDPSTPHIPATLDITSKNGIRLELPFAPDYGLEYAHWFNWTDGKPPEYLAFGDHRVMMHLVGCRATGSIGAIGVDFGVGYLAADYAIEDRTRGRGRYDGVHNVRSQVMGLHEFVGWRMSKTDMGAGKDGRLRDVTIRTVTPDDVLVGELNGIKLHIKPHWWGGERSRAVAMVHERTCIVTESADPRPIADHLLLHATMRDLIAFAFWNPLDFTEREVQHHDHPERVLTGDAVGPAWRRLYSVKQIRAEQPFSDDDDVRDVRGLSPFRLENMGVQGVQAWFEIHREWNRVIDPLLRLLFAPHPTVDVGLLQTSMAMEAYGYLTAMHQNVSRRRAARLSYKDRLADAVATLPLNLTDIVGTVDHWIQRAASAYNGLKHADNPLPSGPEAHLIALTHIAILRLHIMRLLGVPQSTLAQFEQDPSWWQLKEEYRRYFP